MCALKCIFFFGKEKLKITSALAPEPPLASGSWEIQPQTPQYYSRLLFKLCLVCF